MSELTSLTKLDLVLASRSDYPFDLSWVYDIVTLKHLELKVQGSFTVSEKLTQLRELTSLTLNADGATGQASYSVDWESMQALKQFEVVGPIAFDFRMLQLTTSRVLTVLG